jgi:hypothetical protein
MRRRTGNKVQDSSDQQYTEKVPAYLLIETESFLLNGLKKNNNKVTRLTIPMIYHPSKFMDVAKKCGYEIIYTGVRNIEKDDGQIAIENIIVLKQKITI